MQQSLFAVARFGDGESLLFEIVAEQRQKRGFVLDNEDAGLHQAVPPCPFSSGGSSVIVVRSRLGRICASGLP
jgi:hypothetical protein